VIGGGACGHDLKDRSEKCDKAARTAKFYFRSFADRYEDSFPPLLYSWGGGVVQRILNSPYGLPQVLISRDVLASDTAAAAYQFAFESVNDYLFYDKLLYSIWLKKE
jgi:hypothetical protein